MPPETRPDLPGLSKSYVAPEHLMAPTSLVLIGHVLNEAVEAPVRHREELPPSESEGDEGEALEDEERGRRIYRMGLGEG